MGNFDANTDVNTTFTEGQSYAMSRSTNGSVSFTGTLKIDDTPKTVSSEEWNVIGNPYTAFIPLNKNSDVSFLNDNLTDLHDDNKAVYVWDNSQNKYIAIADLGGSTAKSLAPGQGF